jgi:hypothetical protein
MRARERTLATCRRACQRINAQLLDETVVLEQLRPVRGSNGGVVLARRYRFEFSLEGDDRRIGRVRLLGSRIVDLQLEHPEGLTLVSPPDG